MAAHLISPSNWLRGCMYDLFKCTELLSPLGEVGLKSIFEFGFGHSIHLSGKGYCQEVHSDDTRVR